MRHLDVMWVYWNLIKQTKNIYTSFLFIPVITYKPGSSIHTNTVKRILNPMCLSSLVDFLITVNSRFC